MNETGRNILESEVFKGLDKSKQRAICNFLEKGSREPEDIIKLYTEINAGGELTDRERGELLNVIYAGLDEKSRKRLANIMEIVKAFT